MNPIAPRPRGRFLGDESIQRRPHCLIRSFQLFEVPALLLRLGLGSSLWSVSRGLARAVDRYKSALTYADALLREAFYKGEVPRGRAPGITGYEERRARETVSALIEKGLLLAKGPRSTLTLGFPMIVLERWLPTLYPIDPAMIP
jgi:hypothetical protein